MQLYIRKLFLLHFSLQLRSVILVLYMHVLLNWITINVTRDPQIKLHVTSKNDTCHNVTREFIEKIPYATKLNKQHRYIDGDFFEQFICTYILGMINSQFERWLLLLGAKEMVYDVVAVSEFLKITIVYLTGGCCVVECTDL